MLEYLSSSNQSAKCSFHALLNKAQTKTDLHYSGYSDNLFSIFRLGIIVIYENQFNQHFKKLQ